MNTYQVADFLGRSEQIVKKYVKKGYLTPKLVWRGYVFDENQVLDFALNPPDGLYFYIGNDAADIIKQLKISLRQNASYGKVIKPRYSRPRFLEVYQGYDFLQFLGLARIYITRKYKIDQRQLDLFLFLAPLNYFSLVDFHRFPKPYTLRTIEPLIKRNMIVQVTKPIQMKKRKVNVDSIYTLGKKMREAVEEFYELLALEKPYDPESYVVNGKSSVDGKRRRLIKHIESYSNKELLEKLYKD